MRVVSLLVALAVAASTVGCATAPQAPVQLSPQSLSTKDAKIGVAMTAVPKVDTHLPGASCLLCIAFASAANSALTSHAQTLPQEGLPKLKDDLAESLRKKGLDVFVVPEELVVRNLPDFNSKEPNFSRKDFSALRDKYKVDKLLVVDLSLLGFERTYSAYIPTSDPKAVLRGTGYLVDLKTHALEWYAPVDVVRSADGKWDEPPKFPGLTNAYFQVVELGKDSFLKPLSN
jgi:hypothetical protein